jgi:hypothetical protein
MGGYAMRIKYPKDLSALAEFLIENGWKPVKGQDKWMLSYLNCCVRFDPEAGNAVDIEFIDADSNDFFVFSSIRSFVDYCKEKYILDNGEEEEEEFNDEGISVYIDGHGEETFDSVQEAMEYLNGMITITVNGKTRKLK